MNILKKNNVSKQNKEINIQIYFNIQFTHYLVDVLHFEYVGI